MKVKSKLVVSISLSEKESDMLASLVHRAEKYNSFETDFAHVFLDSIGAQLQPKEPEEGHCIKKVSR